MSRSVLLAIRFLSALSPIIFSGCAVYMAAKGRPEPIALGTVIGEDRNKMITSFGPPKESVDSDGGRVEVYEYKSGTQPAPWRAVVHGILDLSSLGLWEVVGTPIEMAQSGKERITVEYDESGKVVNILPNDASAAGARSPNSTGNEKHASTKR